MWFFIWFHVSICNVPAKVPTLMTVFCWNLMVGARNVECPKKITTGAEWPILDILWEGQLQELDKDDTARTCIWCVCMYIYICICIYICMYVYIYIYGVWLRTIHQHQWRGFCSERHTTHMLREGPLHPRPCHSERPRPDWKTSPRMPWNMWQSPPFWTISNCRDQ